MQFCRRLWQFLASRRDLSLGVPAVVVLLAALTAWVYYPAWRGQRHWNQAEQALQRMDLPGACGHLRAYLDLRPEDAEGHFLLARTLRRASRFDEAVIQLREARRLDWVRESIELEELLLRVQQHGVRGADKDRLLAWLQAGHHEDKILLEAMFLGDRSVLNFTQAGQWLGLWIERYPDDWPPRVWRAALWESVGQFTRGRADWLRALEIKPDLAEPLLHLGQIALTEGSRYDEAEDYLSRYLAVRPGHPEALLGLARCARGRGDVARARELLLQLLAADPDHAGAALLLGSIENAAGNDDEALRWLRRAQRAGADPQIANYHLAQVLRRQGNTKDADVCEQKLKKCQDATAAMEQKLGRLLNDPGNPGLLHEIGCLYQVLDKDKESERWFLSALEHAPGHRPSHEALAAFYARRRQPGDAARAAEHRRLAQPGPQ